MSYTDKWLQCVNKHNHSFLFTSTISFERKFFQGKTLLIYCVLTECKIRVSIFSTFTNAILSIRLLHFCEVKFLFGIKICKYSCLEFKSMKENRSPKRDLDFRTEELYKECRWKFCCQSVRKSSNSKSVRVIKGCLPFHCRSMSHWVKL